MSPRDTVAGVAPAPDEAPAPDPATRAPAAGDPAARDPAARDAAARDAADDPGLRALGRDAQARAERELAPAAGTREPEPPASASETVRPEGKNPTVDLARVAWLVTVLACLLAVTILVLQGYVGYAGVTLAVAVAAGINLL
jgi:hypothetical protein